MPTGLELHLGDYVAFLLNSSMPSSFHHLLLACMPKSGSTWLGTMLSLLPDFRSAVLVNGFDRREQELSEIQLLFNRRWNYVSPMHVRYSEPTARLIHMFNLKPIVLVRNVFDIVPSIRDHWRSEGVRGPACYLKNEMTDWPDDKVEEFIVDMGMPWYFNFFLSWTECENKLLLTYEEVRQDPHRVLEKICDHYSIAAMRSEIDNAIDSAAICQHTRLNKAVVGRGESLSATAKQRILTMASYYPGVDFTSIGITAESGRPADDSYIVSSRISSQTKSEIEALLAPAEPSSPAGADEVQTRQTVKAA